MYEIENIVQFIIKLYIIINASNLGWNIQLNNNVITLTKKNNDLTLLDKNTPKLLEKLFKNIW